MLFFNGFVTHIEPDYIFPSGCRIWAFEIVLDGISENFSFTFTVFFRVLLCTNNYRLRTVQAVDTVYHFIKTFYLLDLFGIKVEQILLDG